MKRRAELKLIFFTARGASKQPAEVDLRCCEGTL